MMLKNLLAVSASAALCLAAASAHAITVDGNLDSGYGSAKSTVVYDPTTPSGNFQSPGPTTNSEGYSIYLASDASNVYAFFQGTGTPQPVDTFANIYFDIDPNNTTDQPGSDLGFEINASHADAFIPGVSGNVTLSNIQTATSGSNFEVAIPLVDFEQPITGLTYNSGQQFATSGSPVMLRLSQTFGYSVAGGSTYGPDRLGDVTVGGASSGAPEPSTWVLMILGVGMVGAGLRRSRLNPTSARLSPG